MNFTSRITLGDTLAQKLERLRGKEAVIVCLQESSLLTCLIMAKQLRAWVYPLIYAPVHAPDGMHQLLGAYDQDGEFCANPEEPEVGDDMTAKVARTIKSLRPAAMKSIRAQIKSYDLTPNRHILDGRDVVLAADVVTSALPLAVAQELLKQVSPKSIAVAVGNATPRAAELIRVSAMQTDILDVLTGVAFDEDHYFELADTHSAKEKHTLTKHIAAFWQ